MRKMIKPCDLRCEYGRDPIGIDVPEPRLSWIVDVEKRGGKQSAYQIQVFNLNEDKALVWDSGRVETSKSVNIPYNGEKLASCTRYGWNVNLWDAEGNQSGYSDEAIFETSFMSEDEWTADWIHGKNMFRTTFRVEKDIARSRIYVSGLGYYVLHVNGKRIGDHVLDPACTDYDKLALYMTYDVDAEICRGENAIGVMLGNGRYSPYDSTCEKNWHPLKKYGPSPVMILEQHIWYTDGTKDVISSGIDWKTTDGPIVFDDIYDGETYDARKELPGWDSPGYDDADWENTVLVSEGMGKLVSQGTVPPIRVIKPRTAVKLTQPAPDTYLFDFGQNFSGWLHLKVKGPAGTVVKIHTGELMHQDTGMLNPNTNRGAVATDTYICKGEGLEEYEPSFTYHGFRYVELTGYPGTPSVDCLEARVVHSSVEPIGSFSCSNELINQIHSNYRWTQVSNLHGVPTDCCQRDERMGWIGDAQMTAEAAIYNFDMASFYTKFEQDIRLAQYDSGSISGVSPPYWDCNPVDPTYATACVEFPWQVSHYYDDERIIEDNLEGMCKWVDFLATQEKEDGIVDFGQFGDWCPPMHTYPVETPTGITATWYYCHDALFVSKMAERLGRKDIAEKYFKVFERTRDAFNAKYLKEDRYSASKYSDEELAEKIKTWLQVLPEEEKPAVMRRYATLYSASSQTANLLPLWLGIVPKEYEAAVLQTLVNDFVNTRSKHIDTGVIGLKFMFDVLLRYGQEELAYELLTQTTFPSFGYQIREGATTLWERWEFLDSDKVFNSHSHPFAGSVDAWLFKNIGGVRLMDGYYGFSGTVLRPLMIKDIQYGSASVDSVYGRVASNWHRDRDKLEYSAIVPGNTEALICVPKNGFASPVITEGETVVWKDGLAAYTEALSDAKDEGKYITFHAGAGTYQFTVTRD